MSDRVSASRALAVAVVAVAALLLPLVPQGATAAPAATNRYIVTLSPSAVDAAPVARAQLAALGAAAPKLVFRHALRGYVAELTSTQVTALRAVAGVAAVERDGVMSI